MRIAIEKKLRLSSIGGGVEDKCGRIPVANLGSGVMVTRYALDVEFKVRALTPQLKSVFLGGLLF